MKLSAFRIKNFRSIVDSGWHNLASDNITGLIGQNESGKTAVLEALKCFYDGEISEDVQRRGAGLPEVYCSFHIGSKKLKSLFDEQLLPEGLLDKVTEIGNRINLKRNWTNLNESNIFLEEEALIDIFQSHAKKLLDKEAENDEKIKKAIESADQASKVVQEYQIQLQQADQSFQKTTSALALLQKNFDAATEDAPKAEAQKALKTGQVDLDKAKKIIESIQNKLSNKIEIETELAKKAECARSAKEAETKVIEAEQAVQGAEKELEVLNNKLDKTNDDAAKKLVKREIAATQKIITSFRQDLDEAGNNLTLQKSIAIKIIEGEPIEEAKASENSDLASTSSISIDAFTQQIFNNIPQFEFFDDFSSLLPNSIDLEDLEKNNSKVEGFNAVRNFLSIAGLDINFFNQSNNRNRKGDIDDFNETITINFRKFWSQTIGIKNKIKIIFELEHYDNNVPDKKGKPYLEFWIKDGRERLYPKQRSKGVRWFLSFYLQLQAAAKISKERGRVLLIDEPGLSLHQRAQEDVIKVFEDIKDDIQIIYTTHSPHLVKLDTIYRLLAIQRANVEDDKSETLIIDPHKLGAASSDTLSPIYTLMGCRFSEQQEIKQKNNVILEEISAFYYITSFFILCKSKQKPSFLPATGVSNIPQLANLFLGWGLDFIVVVDDDSAGRREYNKLKKDLFNNVDEKADKKLLKIKDCNGIEDIFSTSDFKKFIIKKESEDLGEYSNTEFLKENRKPKGVFALDFKLKVENGEITIDNLEKPSRDKIKELVKKIEELLK